MTETEVKEQPLPHVIVVDDHDDVSPYLVVGEGHYPVTRAYHQDGQLVVVLDFHAMFRTIRSFILSSRGGSSSAPDPGA